MPGIFTAPDTPWGVFDALSADWLRPLAVFLDKGNDAVIQQAEAATGRGLKVALTVRSNGELQAASTPVDAGWYRRQLRPIVERLRPAILIVENEPNWDHYWGGTAQQLLDEIGVAVDVAHPVGVLVAGGSLVSSYVNGLAAEHYLEKAQGAKAGPVDTKRAVKFAAGASGDDGIGTLDDVERMLRGADLDFGRDLLSGLKKTGADLVDFHRYNGDAYSFRWAIRYLRDTTGLEVMCGEAGVWDEGDTGTLSAMLRVARDESCTPLIVNNTMANANDPNKPLAGPDGKLTRLGRTFASLAGRWKRESLTAPAEPTTL